MLEKRVFGKIYGEAKENNQRRRRTNKGLMQIYGQLKSTVIAFKTYRMTWLGYVAGLSNSRSTKQILKESVLDKRPKQRPNTIWKRKKGLQLEEENATKP